MSILLISKSRDLNPFKDELLKLDKNLDVDIWPAVQSKSRITFAVAWDQPEGQFTVFPNLKVISSLGAGADHLLRDESIPESVDITRIVASGLTSQMCDYVTMSVLNITRRTNEYMRQQLQAEWEQLRQYKKKELTIGVMGLGKLGRRVARRLADNGFKVSGWSKTKKTIPGAETFTENELDSFLSESNILVCLLPLTPDTEGILNLDLFKKLANPSFIINVARGEHLIEEDLLYALNMDILKHATLDVFEQEPLPDSHLFWSRDNITITPHIASVTQPNEIAELILENYKRMLSGQELLNKVDRDKGY